MGNGLGLEQNYEISVEVWLSVWSDISPEAGVLAPVVEGGGVHAAAVAASEGGVSHFTKQEVVAASATCLDELAPLDVVDVVLLWDEIEDCLDVDNDFEDTEEPVVEMLAPERGVLLAMAMDTPAPASNELSREHESNDSGRQLGSEVNIFMSRGSEGVAEASGCVVLAEQGVVTVAGVVGVGATGNCSPEMGGTSAVGVGRAAFSVSTLR